MSLTALRPGDPDRIGEYVPVGRLGAGGMGVVFLARAADGQLVAIKQLRAEFAEDPAFRGRFRREAAALLRVRGSFTARVLAIDVDAPRPFLVMEYVPGVPLAEHVEAFGPLAGPALDGFAAALAQALASVHAAGVVHRDLKPGNVLMADGGPKVIDFGVAQIAEATALTRTGITVGTPGYLAPEQVSGAAGPAADIFSWASTVIFAATGRAPFGAGATDAVLYRVLHDEPDLTGVPERLVPVLRAALSKHPEARPTADELAARLSGGTDNTTVLPYGAPPAMPVGSGHIPPRPVRGRRWWPTGVAATVVAILLVASFLTAESLHNRSIVRASATDRAGRVPTTGTPARSTATATPGLAATSPARAVTTPPAAASTAPAAPAATLVLTFQPWTPGGLAVKPVARASGSCWENSLATQRRDAFRCMVGNLIYDPCFSSPFQSPPTQVACVGTSPSQLTLVDLTQALPQSTGGSSGSPWLIVLVDGQSCGLITGATTTVGGLRLSYACPDGDLYGDPDTTRQTWTIQYQAKGGTVLAPVPIAAVYE